MNGRSRIFANTASGHKQLQAWIAKNLRSGTSYQIVMEATGSYYEEAAFFLSQQKLRLSVVLPNRSNAYAKSLGLKSRNDKVDAAMLARMGVEKRLDEWKAPNEVMMKIKRLCRERRGYMHYKTMINNRKHARSHTYKPDPNSLERADGLLTLVDAQIKAIEAELKTRYKSDQALAGKVDQICSIPGIAMLTALAILEETNGFNLFRKKGQLVSFSGYDVKTKQSGTSVNERARISKQENSFTRAALFFPAITAVKYCPHLQKAYERI